MSDQYYPRERRIDTTNSSNSSIILCPEQRRGLLKTGLALASLLVLANFSLLLALVQSDLLPSVGVSREVSIGDDIEPISASDSKHSGGKLLPRRLPGDFRYAREEECPAAISKLTQYANASMVPKIPHPQQRIFVLGGYENIDKGSGDFKLVGPITMKLSRIQNEEGIFGSIAELGVHHGRFTGALFITARENEKLIAADLFEDLQYQNIDVSGYGNKQAFVNGMRMYGLNESDLHLIHTGSTEDIPFDWYIRNDFEPFRLISVDAGHTAGLTFNDLEIAFCNALRGSIIILDDFFHNLWPGVTEGFYQFAQMGPIEGVYPFLRCEGKNFVTNDKDLHKKYYNALRNEPKFKLFLSAYAHQVRGSKVKYTMNGIEYLRCDSSKLSKETLNLLWSSVVY